MATTNTKSTIETVLKYTVENELADFVPNSAIIQKAAPFKKLGRKYLHPVALTHELGVTFGSADAFSYNASIAGVYEEIDVDPNPVVLRSQWGFEAADRAASRGKQAVKSHVELRTGRMKDSLMKFLEIECLFGRSAVGIGVLSAASDSSGTVTCTISDATWAPGIWGGMEGVLLDIYTSGASQRNANGDFTLSTVDHDNKQIVITGNTTDAANIVATDVLYFKGAQSASQLGLFYQLDTSGTIFGINNSTYSLWKGNEYAVGGAFTMAKALKGSARAVTKGGLNSDAMLVVSPATFEGLNTELAALRQYDSSYSDKKLKIGTNKIEYAAQFGKMEIVSHPFMMEGYSMLIPKNELVRPGATDVTFGIPGKEGQHVEALEGSYAYQILCRASFQILLKCPAKAVLYTGITNS